MDLDDYVISDPAFSAYSVRFNVSFCCSCSSKSRGPTKKHKVQIVFTK